MSLTWDGLFYLLDLEWCQDCPVYADKHEGGFLALNTFHWRKRRITKSGIYRVLKKIAIVRIEPGLPKWRTIYGVNHDVAMMAASLNVRLPRGVSDPDRARLRYELSSITNEDMRRMTPSEQQDYRRARRWAARS